MQIMTCLMCGTLNFAMASRVPSYRLPGIRQNRLLAVPDPRFGGLGIRGVLVGPVSG